MSFRLPYQIPRAALLYRNIYNLENLNYLIKNYQKVDTKKLSYLAVKSNIKKVTSKCSKRHLDVVYREKSSFPNREPNSFKKLFSSSKSCTPLTRKSHSHSNDDKSEPKNHFEEIHDDKNLTPLEKFLKKYKNELMQIKNYPKEEKARINSILMRREHKCDIENECHELKWNGTLPMTDDCAPCENQYIPRKSVPLTSPTKLYDDSEMSHPDHCIKQKDCSRAPRADDFGKVKPQGKLQSLDEFSNHSFKNKNVRPGMFCEKIRIMKKRCDDDEYIVFPPAGRYDKKLIGMKVKPYEEGYCCYEPCEKKKIVSEKDDDEYYNESFKNRQRRTDRKKCINAYGLQCVDPCLPKLMKKYDDSSMIYEHQDETDLRLKRLRPKYSPYTDTQVMKKSKTCIELCNIDPPRMDDVTCWEPLRKSLPKISSKARVRNYSTYSIRKKSLILNLFNSETKIKKTNNVQNKTFLDSQHNLSTKESTNIPEKDNLDIDIIQTLMRNKEGSHNHNTGNYSKYIGGLNLFRNVTYTNIQFARCFGTKVSKNKLLSSADDVQHLKPNNSFNKQYHTRSKLLLQLKELQPKNAASFFTFSDVKLFPSLRTGEEPIEDKFHCYHFDKENTYVKHLAKHDYSNYPNPNLSNKYLNLTKKKSTHDLKLEDEAHSSELQEEESNAQVISTTNVSDIDSRYNKHTISEKLKSFMLPIMRRSFSTSPGIKTNKEKETYKCGKLKKMFYVNPKTRKLNIRNSVHRPISNPTLTNIPHLHIKPVNRNFPELYEEATEAYQSQPETKKNETFDSKYKAEPEKYSKETENQEDRSEPARMRKEIKLKMNPLEDIQTRLSNEPLTGSSKKPIKIEKRVEKKRIIMEKKMTKKNAADENRTDEKIKINAEQIKKEEEFKVSKKAQRRFVATQDQLINQNENSELKMNSQQLKTIKKPYNIKKLDSKNLKNLNIKKVQKSKIKDSHKTKTRYLQKEKRPSVKISKLKNSRKMKHAKMQKNTHDKSQKSKGKPTSSQTTVGKKLENKKKRRLQNFEPKIIRKERRNIQNVECKNMKKIERKRNDTIESKMKKEKTQSSKTNLIKMNEHIEKKKTRLFRKHLKSNKKPYEVSKEQLKQEEKKYQMNQRQIEKAHYSDEGLKSNYTEVDIFDITNNRTKPDETKVKTEEKQKIAKKLHKEHKSEKENKKTKINFEKMEEDETLAYDTNQNQNILKTFKQKPDYEDDSKPKTMKKFTFKPEDDAATEEFEQSPQLEPNLLTPNKTKLDKDSLVNANTKTIKLKLQNVPKRDVTQRNYICTSKIPKLKKTANVYINNKNSNSHNVVVPTAKYSDDVQKGTDNISSVNRFGKYSHVNLPKSQYLSKKQPPDEKNKAKKIKENKIYSKKIFLKIIKKVQKDSFRKFSSTCGKTSNTIKNNINDIEKNLKKVKQIHEKIIDKIVHTKIDEDDQDDIRARIMENLKEIQENKELLISTYTKQIEKALKKIKELKVDTISESSPTYNKLTPDGKHLKWDEKGENKSLIRPTPRDFKSNVGTKIPQKKLQVRNMGNKLTTGSYQKKKPKCFDDCEFLEDDCPVLKTPPKYILKKKKRPTILTRVLQYFKARPNCPTPQELKRKRLLSKAKNAANAAGLDICIKKKCKGKIYKRNVCNSNMGKRYHSTFVGNDNKCRLTSPPDISSQNYLLYPQRNVYVGKMYEVKLSKIGVKNALIPRNLEDEPYTYCQICKFVPKHLVSSINDKQINNNNISNFKAKRLNKLK